MSEPVSVDQHHYIAALREEVDRLNADRLMLMALLRQRDTELVAAMQQAQAETAAPEEEAEDPPDG